MMFAQEFETPFQTEGRAIEEGSVPYWRRHGVGVEDRGVPEVGDDLQSDLARMAMQFTERFGPAGHLRFMADSTGDVIENRFRGVTVEERFDFRPHCFCCLRRRAGGRRIETHSHPAITIFNI